MVTGRAPLRRQRLSGILTISAVPLQIPPEYGLVSVGRYVGLDVPGHGISFWKLHNVTDGIITPHDTLAQCFGSTCTNVTDGNYYPS
jgi:hypothetical protein